MILNQAFHGLNDDVTVEEEEYECIWPILIDRKNTSTPGIVREKLHELNKSINYVLQLYP